MTELIILAVLIGGEHTIYRIKQKIKNSFSVFLSASFGSIHPALRKLEKDGYISAKRKMSNGGQKSSFYSITNKGKEYFKELMTAEIDEPVSYSNQMANIKIMLFDQLDESLRKNVIESIKRYYEISMLNTRDLLESLEAQQAGEKEKKIVRIRLLKHYADKISREISWIEGLINANKFK
jgi:DNA-binding PadR family transcriptional regulator